VFTLETLPKLHLITVYLKEMKVSEIEIFGETWKIKDFFVQKENVLSGKNIVACRLVARQQP
jgi:hypothetical protein